MSITQSDDNNNNSNSQQPKMQPVYEGAIANFTPEDLSTLTLEQITDLTNKVINRYEQAAEMRRDLIVLAKAWAELHQYKFISNVKGTWYLGPTSPSTKSSQTMARNGWTLIIAISNPRMTKLIHQAIEDMETVGFRVKRTKAPTKRPEPKSSFTDQFNL